VAVSEIFIRVAVAQRVWGKEVSQRGSGAKPRYRRLRMGHEVPAEAEVCRHCLQILTAETIKIWTFRTIDLLILDQSVSRYGSSIPIYFTNNYPHKSLCAAHDVCTSEIDIGLWSDPNPQAFMDMSPLYEKQHDRINTLPVPMMSILTISNS